MNDWVVVGRVGAPFGVRGWVKIHSHTTPGEHVFSYLPWRLVQNERRLDCKLEAFKPHGNGFIAKLATYETPETVATLTNMDIYIERAQLPVLNSGEFYWSDLPGLTVVNRQEELLGQVDRLFDNGAQDILVVRGEKEYWIPFIMKHYIDEIDVEKKLIKVDWHPDDTAKP